VKRVFSDPFGATRGGSDAGVPGDHRFLGAVRDTGSGLTLLGARYYDESTGQFISVDPLLDAGNPAQFNAYVYSGNNPATWSDPSGMAWKSDAPAASGVKKKAGTTQPPPSTSWAAREACGGNIWCLYSWGFGAAGQVYGGIGEGLGDLVWTVCTYCHIPEIISEYVEMFSDWDGWLGKKTANLQAIADGGIGGIFAPMVDEWNNNPGHLIGGAAVTVGTIVVPGGAALKGVSGVKAVATMAPKARSAASAGDGLLAPGAHAGRSITGDSTRNFLRGQRDELNEIMGDTGCHKCGTLKPGTKSGDAIPDHQPPLSQSDGPYQLYPHCLSCSREQGLLLANLARRGIN
jgi:RHS repeat-associated protein